MYVTDKHMSKTFLKILTATLALSFPLMVFGAIIPTPWQRDTTNLKFYNPFFSDNVGIGTTSPYAKLSVVGQIVGAYFTATTSTASQFPYASSSALTATGEIYAESGITQLGINLIQNDSSTGIMDVGSGGGAAGGLRICRPGSFGCQILIGSAGGGSELITLAGSGVQVSGTNAVNFFSTGYNIKANNGLEFTTASGDPVGFLWNIGSTPIMNLSAPAGNLGIGTSSPSQRLSVHGGALISGDITSVANITATGTVTSNISTSSSYFGGNLPDCDDGTNSKLLWSDTGKFSCGADSTGGAGSVDGAGFTGMMTSWTDSNTIQSTSTIVGAQFIATSTTATSTFAGGISASHPTQANGFIEAKRPTDAFARSYLDGFGTLYFGGAGTVTAPHKLGKDSSTAAYANYTNTLGPASIFIIDSDVANPGGTNAESTITLRRKVSGGAEFMDMFNNGYTSNGDVLNGLLFQKTGAGSYRDFIMGFYGAADTDPGNQIKNAAVAFSISTSTRWGTTNNYSQGLIGIGKRYANAILDVNTATGTHAFLIASSSSPGTISNPVFIVDKFMNVGISTSSPWRALSVYGSSDLGNSALAGFFTATSTSSFNTFAGTTTVPSLQVGPTAIANNGLKLSIPTGMTISGSESVGGVFNMNTGTTDALGMTLYNNHTGTSRLLSLVCDAATYGGNCFHVRNDGTESAFNILGATVGKGVGKLTHQTAGDADASILSLDASGNYDGQAVFVDCTGGSCDATNNALSIANDLGTNGMGLTVKWGGNVGLGTTTPYAKLSVVGPVVASHFVGTTTAASSLGGALSVTGTLTTPTYTSAILLTDANGLVAEYAGATCTNQFVRVLSALGAATCATVGSADVDLADLTATDGTLTFSGTYNGSTARTIGLNLASANDWTALQTFSNASTTKLSSNSTILYNLLRIPTSTDPVISTVGDIAINTTAASSSLEFHDGTEATAVYSIVDRSFTLFASTSLNSNFVIGASTTQQIGFAGQKSRMDRLMCAATGGTFQMRIGDGSNWTNTSIFASGTTTVSSFANNTFEAYEPIWIEVRPLTGASKLTCTRFFKNI